MDRIAPAAAETHAVVVTKPGDETVRFGPLTQGTAGSWAAILRMIQHSSAPEGTTVHVLPCTPGLGPYIDPGSIPRTVEDLMEPFRADKGYPANGGFPDLHARLVMVHGYNRGAAMWDEACRIVDAEDAVDEAEAEIRAAVSRAAEAISRAAAEAEEASDELTRMLGQAARWELEIPGVRHPQDASDHLRVAARELRAAARVLHPAGEGA